MQPWGRVATWGLAAIAGAVAGWSVGGPPWGWAVVAIALAAVRVPAARWRVAPIVALLAAALAARERAAEAVAAPAGVDDRDRDVVEGWIAGPLVPLGDATGLVIEADDVGPVWAVVDGAPAAWPGDRVRATGRLMRPRGFRDPGSPDRRAVARNRGARYELRGAALRVVAADDRPSAWRWPAQAARALSARIAARGGDPVGNALMRALVVGDRGGLDRDTDDAWRAAGVYHALSVSGLHLAVVALLAFAALTRALAYLPAVAGRIAPRRAAAVAAAPIAIAYVLVTGGQVATARSLVVVLVALYAAWSERAIAAIDALGLAALVAVATRPSVVFDPSFQLSFVATATLIAAAGGPRATGSLWRRALASVIAAIRLSWIVTLTTAPITAWHFGQVSLGGVVGNLIVGPALELCALPLGVVGAAVPIAGDPLLDLAIAIAGWTARAVAALAAHTPTLEVRAVGPLELAAACALGLAWSWSRRAGGRRAALLAAVAATVLGGAWWSHRDHRPAALTVTFLDVGQGDAAVIEWPDGGVWLVDAGGAPGAGDLWGELAPGRAVAGFLRARGIRRVEVAIVSHPHPDHYLGLLAVAAAVPIDALWEARAADAVDEPAPAPGAPTHGARSFEAVAQALAATGTRRVHPRLGRWRRGDVTVELLAPRGAVDDVATARADHGANDNSLVVRLERGGASVLLLGDVEAAGEAALVGDGLAAATVVKVAHHGSATSSSPALVAATRPRWAVMSLGVANRFGFPAPAVVARWQAIGATVVRTDQAGAVTVRLDEGGQVTLSTFDAPPGETAQAARVIMPP